MSTPRDQKVHLRTVVPGPSSRALREREDAHIAPGLQGYAVMAGIAVDHAEGSAVTDVDGNTFLDFIGGIGVNALGHGHPEHMIFLPQKKRETGGGGRRVQTHHHHGQ